MQIKLFTIPVVSGEQVGEDLNRFLRSQKIVDVEKHLVTLRDSAFWTFCITYLPGGSPAAETHSGERREKVDYKQVLDEACFAVFSRLRVFRKQIADREAIPAYAIFTDAELAEIAKMEHPTASGLRAISGIGAKKIEKYGAEICRMLEDEASGVSN